MLRPADNCSSQTITLKPQSSGRTGGCDLPSKHPFRRLEPGYDELCRMFVGPTRLWSFFVGLIIRAACIGYWTTHLVSDPEWGVPETRERGQIGVCTILYTTMPANSGEGAPISLSEQNKTR
jgi:hypothetical protein